METLALSGLRMRNFEVFLYEHEYIGRFLNLHQCTFKITLHKSNVSQQKCNKASNFTPFITSKPPKTISSFRHAALQLLMHIFKAGKD